MWRIKTFYRYCNLYTFKDNIVTKRVDSPTVIAKVIIIVVAQWIVLEIHVKKILCYHHVQYPKNWPFCVF